MDLFEIKNVLMKSNIEKLFQDWWDIRFSLQIGSLQLDV